MATLLEQQVTEVLTAALGRAPTAEEIRLGTLAPYPLSDIHNTANIAQNTISISDTDDIQDAIDKINTNGGGVVYLNPGTYNVTSDITMYSNIYLVGLVKNLCIIDFGGASRSIVMSGLTDVTLQELTIQNSSDNGIKIYNNSIGNIIIINNVDIIDCNIGIDCSNAFGINIIGGGCSVSSCSVGLKMDTVIGFTVDNSSFAGNSSHGIQMIDTSFGIIRDSLTQANSGDAINCENIDVVAFEALILIDGLSNGIVMDVGCIGNRIFGCRISAHAGVGISIGNSATACINNIISSNSISSNTGVGIDIVGANATNNIISSNIILANAAPQVSDSGTTTLIRSNRGIADAGTSP